MLASANSGKKSTEKTVKILLKHNANVDFQDARGWTALINSVYGSRRLSTEKTVKMLLKYGANVNIPNNYGKQHLCMLLNNQN